MHNSLAQHPETLLTRPHIQTLNSHGSDAQLHWLPGAPPQLVPLEAAWRSARDGGCLKLPSVLWAQVMHLQCCLETRGTTSGLM